MFINEELVRGTLDPASAIGAICDSMDTPLSDCISVQKMQASKLVKLYELREQENQQDMSKNVLLILVIMVVIFSAGVCFFKAMIRKNFEADIERSAANGVA